MITDEELQISNESYTSKDFLSIYPELLDIIKKISPNWDPSLSNESDPGNVLLKVLAYIGDKVNYNTDKNVLENFLPSATQETSVRNLCEVNGYYPKYYQSAVTTVKIRYDGTKLVAGDSLTFPAMNTVITDENNVVSYSLLKPCTLSKRKVPEEVPVIQGLFETLTVGGSDVIQLSDLDDNNRLYFPEPLVAQNGVFVYNKDSYIEGETSADDSETGSSWKRVDNLNLEAPSEDNYIFKFGFDSDAGLPYIEFPNNISELIESGLIIKYVKTAGLAGNVSANTLTKLVTPLQYKTHPGEVEIDFSLPEESSSETNYDANNLVIFNPGGTVGGTNPETINEAYNAFKKTVGTFNTLVTCRDYANAIYNLVDDTTGLPYVSNIQVTDRRSDINYGNTILTYTNLGKTFKLNTDPSKITPFDLCLYPLNPINTVYDYTTYQNSFTPLADTSFIENEESEIDKLKTMSHAYKTKGNGGLVSGDIYLIKNYYRLTAKITTTYKVNIFEQEIVKKAINEALYKAFNSRKLDYGYEIPFDTILETIKGASPIIKNVSLDEPYIETKLRFVNGNEVSLNEMTAGVRIQYLTLLAKNILAGRLPLFDYDTDFDYDFGQLKLTSSAIPSGTVPGPKIDNIYSIKTELAITPGSSGLSYNLRDNEIIQCIAPNLQTIITYPAYVNFHYEKNGSSGGILRNEEHQIVGDEILYINYTDSNKDVINVIYEYDGITKLVNGVGVKQTYDRGVFVKANFDVPEYDASSVRYAITKIVEGDEIKFYTLATNEQIEEREVVARALQDSSLNCYWSTNKPNNVLFDSSCQKTVVIDAEGHTQTIYETLLGEGEYFAYCDESKTEVVICGSGTVIQYWGTISDYDKEWGCTKSLIDTLVEGGTSVIENFNWVVKNFSTHQLEIHDMQILTVAAGGSISIPNFSLPVGATKLGNTFIPVDKDLVISYQLSSSDTPVPLPTFSSDSMAWKIRSRLDLNCGPTLKQEIKGEESTTGDRGVHHITITTYNSSTHQTTVLPEISKDGTRTTYISLSNVVQAAGGDNIDLGVTVIANSGITTEYSISAAVFTYSPVQYQMSGVSGLTDLTKLNGIYTIPVSSLTVPAGGQTIDLPILNITGDKTLIMFFANAGAGSTYVVELSAGSTSSDEYIKLYKDSSYVHSLTLTPAYDADNDANKISIVEVSNSVDTITLKVTKTASSDANCSLVIGSLTKAKLGADSSSNVLEYSSVLNLSYNEEAALKAKLAELDTNNLFYYNAPLDKASIIDVNKADTAQFLWDRNNLFNKFTLPQIDFKEGNINIEVVKSSQI